MENNNIVSVYKVAGLEFGRSTFITEDKKPVTAYCAGPDGWHPGENDTVRLFDVNNVLFVEPNQWMDELSEDERADRARDILKGYAEQEQAQIQADKEAKEASETK